VLYEMLTGTRLFRGETVSDILAGVLKTDPSWEALPAETSNAVRRLLQRCLTRDPKDRLHDVADARLDLDEAIDGASFEVDPTAAAPSPARKSKPREILAWLLAAAAIGIATALALRPSVSEPELPLTHFDLMIPEDTHLAHVDQPTVALSPDGQSLAFIGIETNVGAQRIYLRTLDDTAVRPIPGTEGALSATFSPDGQSLAFFNQGQLKRIPIGGGTATNLAVSPNPRGLVWCSDGSIIFSPEYTSGLWRIPATGGTAEVLVETDEEAEERTLRWPDLSPDCRTVVFTIGDTKNPNSYRTAKIGAYSIDSGQRVLLLEGANMARFMGPDRLLIDRSGTLYLADFDARSLQIIGEPVPVREGIGGDPSSGAAYYSLAQSGTLAFVPGSAAQSRAHLSILDRKGDSIRLPLEPRPFHHPRFSPTQDKVAFTIGTGAQGANGDIWIFDLQTEGLNRISFGGNSTYPAFSRDGQWLAFSSESPDPALYRKPVDGSGSAERISPVGLDAALIDSWSPDGSLLAFTNIGATTDIYLLEPGGEPVLFEEDASAANISPDGRWIAYDQPGSGTSSVYVRELEGDGKWQVSPGNGGYPRWSADGRQLFYVDLTAPGRPLMKVDVADAKSFRNGAPQIAVESLASRFNTVTSPAHNWDVSPDGSQFLFVENDRDESDRGQIELILNWAQNLPPTGD
jgi:Tol biopolymer transport system component